MTEYLAVVYESTMIPAVNAQPCRHNIASWVAMDEHPFPMVETKCSACGTMHEFRLVKTFPITSPGQQDQFEKWCDAGQIEVVRRP